MEIDAEVKWMVLGVKSRYFPQCLQALIFFIYRQSSNKFIRVLLGFEVKYLFRSVIEATIYPPVFFVRFFTHSPSRI